MKRTTVLPVASMLRFACLSVRSGVQQSSDREGDAFGLSICAQYFHLHDLPHFYGFARILDVSVRKLTNVNQSVLMHADIDESAELSHVGYNAFQNHSRLCIANFANAFSEAGGHKLVARITARVLQFIENVIESEFADAELSAINFLQQLGPSD